MKKKLFITILLLFYAILSLNAADLGWRRVIDAEVTDFGNLAIYPGGVVNGRIIMGAGRNSGAWIISSPDSYNFVLDEMNGIDDTDNSEIIPAHYSFDGYLYSWTSHSDGTEIWRTYDGIIWSHVSVNGNANGLDGASNNVKAFGGVILNSLMYLGTENPSTGCEIWIFDSSNWTKDADSTADLSGCDGENKAGSAALFNNRVYFGTIHDDCPTQGGGLYYTASPWTVVTSTGFDDIDNLQLYPVYKDFNDYLYVGTLNYSGAQIWRSQTGNTFPGDWEKVVDFSTTAPSGIQENPRDPDCWEASSFSIPGDGYLYVALSNNITGAEIWRTDGTNWEQVNEDGFYQGDGKYNSSVFLSRTLFKGYLFAGTARKPIYGGAQLWKLYVLPYYDENPHVVDEEGEIIVIGSTERKGIINPDKGDTAEIQFRGSTDGRFTLRIFTILGELVHDESKNCLAAGKFFWIPDDISSGTYIVHVKGPGIDKQKKLAILR